MSASSPISVFDFDQSRKRARYSINQEDIREGWESSRTMNHDLRASSPSASNFWKDQSPS